MRKLAPTLLCDFYKISHRNQYPKGTQVIYSTWTPRTSRMPGVNEVVHFGAQMFVQDLHNYFEENFFKRNKNDVVNEYLRIIKYSLNVENPDTSHIEELHDLGYLPLQIRSLPEGIVVPLRTPTMTFENTDHRFFWLTNYIESLASAELWQVSTSATIAHEFRKMLNYYCELTGGDLDFVPFQGHDFSMRGMAGLDSAMKSGMGHLLSFTGTDTIPAIEGMEIYYCAHVEKELIGTSIPATEHSVMCANGQDEYEVFKRFITEIYPAGFVSIVSDSWDFWNVIGNILPALKTEIMARDGRVVIRPDSGDPVKILCGDPYADNKLERKGLIEALYDIFGGKLNSKGYKELDPHIGAIYGDAITLDRATEICKQLLGKGFASTNVVYGIGSFTYQYNTRDTFGYAMKSTYALIDDTETFIFKDPKTDNGVKKSQRGRVMVYREGNAIKFQDGLYLNECIACKDNVIPEKDLLRDIYFNGFFSNFEILLEIRARLSNRHENTISRY